MWETHLADEAVAREIEAFDALVAACEPDELHADTGLAMNPALFRHRVTECQTVIEARRANLTCELTLPLFGRCLAPIRE